MTGVLWATLAMLCWGVGDFLIQRSARAFGDTIALFMICAFGGIVLLPFVLKDIPTLYTDPRSFFLLLLTSCVILFAAVLDFEALRVGKIAVVESIYAIEVPIAAVLAAIAINEVLPWYKMLLILSIMVGTMLVSVTSLHILKKLRLEKGVLLAFIATLGMSASNVLFGVSSREINPFMVNWFTSAFIALVMLGVIIYKRQWKNAWRCLRKQPLLIGSVSIADNLAWLAFSYSTTHIPIAITTGISESYIIIATALGITINKEKLKRHQYIGGFIVIASAITLALLSSDG